MADDLVKLKEQVYVDPRPAEAFDRYHARTREKEPGRAYGTERVPASGPLVIAPNHFSNLDHFFMGMGIRRKIHFMAKSQMFVSPIDKVYANGGTFPVRRGAGDAAAFETVHAILDRGGALGMYCEGGRSRTGKLAERAKPGIGRIALESGATILPTAIHGSSHVRNVKRGQFPQITVLFGAPMRYERLGPGTVSRDDARIVANEIFDEIKALYATVEAGGRDAARAWRPTA